MRIHGVLLAAALAIVSLPALPAAENVSADVVVRDAQAAFRVGEYKKATKLYEKAVKLDPANADYRNGLGEAYERQAELSSFPLLLTAKARNSYVRALALQPGHAGAMAGLIELSAQPIGLCEGDLNEASLLVDRLDQVDPDAAQHAREHLGDAKRDAARPGQVFLCGPVKLSRAVTNHLIPYPTLQAHAPDKTDTVLADQKTPATESAAGLN